MSEQDEFDQIAKSLAASLADGYADDALEGESIGLCDSDTDRSLLIEKRVVLAGRDGPVSLLYTTAKRGRICQVRQANFHIHYFFDESGAQKMIREDERRNGGITLSQILKNAPNRSAPEVKE